MKILIVLLIWTGCLLLYLTSSKQQLLNTYFPKLFAWLGFVLFQGLAVYYLSRFFDPITTGLIWLMLLMCIWIGLTLIASHLTSRICLVSTLGISFFSLIMLLGANYVA